MTRGRRSAARWPSRQRYLGAMLPYTPLHVLLLRAAGRPLVMTSGNLAEEPIVKDGRRPGGSAASPMPSCSTTARSRRATTTRWRWCGAGGRGCCAARGATRRSRSLCREPLPQVLACGAELKNTFCLTRDAYAFLSQHIGDLENLETLEHFETSIALYERLFRIEPEVVAYDLHPEYLATKYALALPQERKVVRAAPPRPRRGAAGRERRVEPVIGVSLDGLGYGPRRRPVGRRAAGGRPARLSSASATSRSCRSPAARWRSSVPRARRRAGCYALLGDDGLARAGRVCGARARGLRA